MKYAYEGTVEFRKSDQYGWIGESGLGEGDTVEIFRRTLCTYSHDRGYESHWAGYSLSTFPGSHAVGISHGVYNNWPDMGLGQYFLKERLSLAREIGMRTLLCTVNSTNEKEKHILQKNGWKKIHTMRDDRWIPASSVELWVIDLDPVMG